MTNFDKILDSAKVNYRPAFVYRKQDFFSIIFYWRPSFTAPFRRFRQTFELNRIPDIAERAKAAEVMANTVTEALKAGWQPETDKFKDAPVKAVAAGIDIGILTAIETALNSKRLKVAKERSRQSSRWNELGIDALNRVQTYWQPFAIALVIEFILYLFVKNMLSKEKGNS